MLSYCTCISPHFPPLRTTQQVQFFFFLQLDTHYEGKSIGGCWKIQVKILTTIHTLYCNLLCAVLFWLILGGLRKNGKETAEKEYEKVREIKTRRERKNLVKKDINWKWTSFYFLQVRGHTHTHTLIARGSSSTACQCSLPSSLFRGNVVRVRCGDNLTLRQKKPKSSTTPLNSQPKLPNI